MKEMFKQKRVIQGKERLEIQEKLSRSQENSEEMLHDYSCTGDLEGK